MSPFAAERGGKPLDSQSRRVLAEFSIQMGVGVALMLALYLIRLQPLPELGRAMASVFQFYCVVDCVRATVARERFGGASLNRWDQAMAYCACALLLHAIA